MDVFEAIKNRRSIRTYKKQGLTQETLNQLCDAARLAPSAGNAQSWAFVVAAQVKTKLALSKAAYGQKSLEEASAVFVVCADEKIAEEAYGSRGKTLYCLQDTAAAVENILLAACAMGLGTCWIGAFREEEIRKVINCPPHMRPVALVPVGYPNESPSARPRRPLNEVMYTESF
jgi:nitroreductase